MAQRQTCRSGSKPAALIFLNQLVARSVSPAWSNIQVANALGCEYIVDSWMSVFGGYLYNIYIYVYYMYILYMYIPSSHLSLFNFPL